MKAWSGRGSSRAAVVTTALESSPPDRHEPTSTSARRRSRTASVNSSRKRSSRAARVPSGRPGRSDHQRSTGEPLLPGHQEMPGRQREDALEEGARVVVHPVERDQVAHRLEARPDAVRLRERQHRGLGGEGEAGARPTGSGTASRRSGRARRTARAAPRPTGRRRTCR